MTGFFIDLAVSKVLINAPKSCPFTGPMYSSPSSSKNIPGVIMRIPSSRRFAIYVAPSGI